MSKVNTSESQRITRIFFLVFMTMLMSAQSGTAQLGGLIRRTTQKLSSEVERMAVEKLSDIIAKKAAEKIESSFDKMLQDAIEQDSSYQHDDSIYYRAGSKYAQFLQGMNDASNLPESYHFDLSILMEMVQGRDKPETVRMFYSKTEPIFAIQTAKSDKESQIMLIDLGNDITVLYQQNGDDKTAQALPNMMKLAKGMAKSYVDPDMKFEFTQTKKKSRIAGYPCVRYIGSMDDDHFEMWVTDKLGIDWQQTQGMLVSIFDHNAYDGKFEEMKGIALKSLQFKGKKGKLISSMEAKEVDTNSFDLITSDYKFGYNN